MNRHVFNAAIGIGWLLVTWGACMLSLPGGLVASGLLLIALTLASAHLAARGVRS